MGRGGSPAFTVPRTADYESPGRVGIQGSVHEARLGLGWLLGTSWAASVDDKGLRIIGVQGPVYLLGLKWLRLTFPKSQVNDHNQGDQIQDSSKHSSSPLTTHNINWGKVGSRGKEAFPLLSIEPHRSSFWRLAVAPWRLRPGCRRGHRASPSRDS